MERSWYFTIYGLLLFALCFSIAGASTRAEAEAEGEGEALQSKRVFSVPDDRATIQEAIDAANPGDVVFVQLGTYYENINFSGKDITVTCNPGTSGNPNSYTTIDGGQNGSVVTISQGEKAAAVLENFRITNGTGTFINNCYCGGGIFINHSTPTISNCIVRDNILIGDSEHHLFGGGIYINLTVNEIDPGPIVENCVVKNNELDTKRYSLAGLEAFGGGIFCYNGNDTTKIRWCTVKENHVRGLPGWVTNQPKSGGGGIGMKNNPSYPNGPHIRKCLIKDNASTGWGGGVFVFNAKPLIEYETRITGNKALEAQDYGYEGAGRSGGGIACINDGLLAGSATLSESVIISENEAADGGGGIYLYDCNPKIIQCEILNNKAHKENPGASYFGGGGICCELSNFEIEQSSISGNMTYTADSHRGDGGGLYIGMWSSPYIKNCKFIGNSAGLYDGDGYGGAICIDGSIYASHHCNPCIFGCLFYGNIAFAWSHGGGAIFINHPGAGTTNALILNCTFSENYTESGSGGSVYSLLTGEDHLLRIRNSILWSDYNTDTQIEFQDPASISVDYSNVQGGWTGAGSNNMNVDPSYVDGYISNFKIAGHLKCDSPCIDAGNDAYLSVDQKTGTDFDYDYNNINPAYPGDPRIMQGLYPNSTKTVDMGADEFATISESLGGTIILYLDAGEEHAFRDFAVFMGATGTSPGKLLPGGLATLPLNWDALTDEVLALALNPYNGICNNFIGTFDDEGQANASLVMPPVAGTQGVPLFFAYCTYNPYDYASMPYPVAQTVIVP